MLDDMLDNMDDEFVEDEFADGFIVMDAEEFVEWCAEVQEGEAYGDA